LRDGSGALDLVDLRRLEPTKWAILFQRVGATGAPSAKPVLLDRVDYIVRRKDGSIDATAVPSQWGVDLKSGPAGSVWVAWEGNVTISVARWSARGRMIVSPHVVVPFDNDVGFDSSQTAVRAIALAPLSTSGIVYHAYPGSLGQRLIGVQFDSRGLPFKAERVSYDQGGSAFFPQAGAVQGHAAVAWQKIGDQDVIEVTGFRRAQSPDWLTRLGLNIGNLPGNVALIAFGALGGGVLLTTINFAIVALLLACWLPIGRFLPRFAAWPVYLAVMAIVLAEFFALPSQPPGWVLAIGGLGSPYGWFAVVGAVFVSWWSGRHMLRHQEALLRAAAMALVAVYFVSVMYGVMYIEGQIGQV
jgi:hypothetical protein